MRIDEAADREGKARDSGGREGSLFHPRDAGGPSSVVRLTSGSRFWSCARPGTEEVVVLSGSVRIGGEELAAGGDLFTEPAMIARSFC